MSDQLIAIHDTLLNSPTHLALLKSRTLSVALGHPLKPLGHITDIHLPVLGELVVLNEVPRCASVEEFLASNLAYRDAVWTSGTRGSRAWI